MSDCWNKRVCVGEKQKTGCGIGHQGYKLFCDKAEVMTNTATYVTSVVKPGPGKEITCNAVKLKPDVLLCAMKVIGARHGESAYVFWDSGSMVPLVGPSMLDIKDSNQGLKCWQSTH